jgi:hypothetical protein
MSIVFDPRSAFHYRAALYLLLATIACALASCGTGGGSRPFAKLDNSRSGKTVPPIFLVEIKGVPNEKVQSLKDALSVASGKRDMAIVEGKFEGDGFGLSGSFQILPESGSARLAYSWTLTDKAGTVLHTIASEEQVPGAASRDPWAGVTPSIFERVAQYTAESLSNRLAQMGYATQLGGLPPPLDNYAMAGPDAEHEIDYETLLGPGHTIPASAAAIPASATAAATTNVSNLPPEPDASMAPGGKETNGRPQIRAVAVLEVSGASGQGNTELTEAMREALSSAGWPVVSSPRKDALTLKGKVDVGTEEGGAQRVALAWTLISPDGETLGTVNQANTVPATSISAGWGDTAIYAAQAAASGIFDLVKTLR